MRLWCDQGLDWPRDCVYTAGVKRSIIECVVECRLAKGVSTCKGVANGGRGNGQLGGNGRRAMGSGEGQLDDAGCG